MFSLNDEVLYSPKNETFEVSYPDINEMTCSESDGKETENKFEVKEESGIPFTD